MNGDFTRVTFDPAKHYARVLMQQGRVQLDSDGNEQAAILLHFLQTLAADLIGPFGGPTYDPSGDPATGFEIGTIPDGNNNITDLSIGKGHYYVDGILCENEQWMDSNGARHNFTYFAQPDYRIEPKYRNWPEGNLLVYLDVWERLITSYEDSSLREVALGGTDTTARAKLVWQVRSAVNMPDNEAIPNETPEGDWREWVKLHWKNFEGWQSENRGLLKAKAREESTQNLDACAVPPGARYRGIENHLYRVEIHKGGDITTKPTFKWSRDNGSVIFPIRKLEGTIAYLDHLGRDDRQRLKIYDWVEVVDDAVALQYDPDMPDQPYPTRCLAQVVQIDPLDMTVTLKTPDGGSLPSYAENSFVHPLLRRWDYSHRDLRDSTDANIPKRAEDGALLIDEENWLVLEEGIQIRFFAPKIEDEDGEPINQQYRAGDYWLIPARTATGDVEWPKEIDVNGNVVLDENGRPKPKALSPHGIQHHYAPLALVIGNQVTDVRNTFCQMEFCQKND